MDIKTTPKVIFRLVAHNSEKTIARAIESVLSQSYENIQLHVCLRGSTDSTVDIANGYAKKDSRVRIIVNKQDFEYDEGNDIKDFYTEYDIENDYVCFMDGDDAYKQDFLEQMLPFALDNNLDIAACGNDNVMEETNQVVSTTKTNESFIIEGGGFDTYFPVYHYYMRTRWGKLLRLSLIDKLDRSRIFYLYYSDDTVEMIEYYRNAGRIGIYPGSLYKWYRARSAISNRWDNRRIETNRIIHELTARYLIEKTGHIKPFNLEFLREVYFNSINDTVSVLFNAQVTFNDTLTALHDIITNKYTCLFVNCSPGYFDNSPKMIFFNNIVKWVSDNEEKLTDKKSVLMVMDILNTIESIQKNEYTQELAACYKSDYIRFR